MYISNYQSCKDFEFDSQWSKDPTPTTIHQEKSIMDLPENQCLFREIEEMKLISSDPFHSFLIISLL